MKAPAKSTAKAPAKRSTTRKPAAKKPAVKPRGGRDVVAKRQGAAAKRAEKAAATAKAQGATGTFGTSAQRSLRDSAVIARLEAGTPQADVASEFKVSARTVRAIRDKRLKSPSPIDELPMSILEGLARDYRTSAADFQAFAYAHADANPSVAVAAMKGTLQARERYLELMSAVGKLPDNLELFRSESVLRQLADAMVEAMVKVEAGEMSAVEAGEFFRSLVAGNEQTTRKAIGAGG